MKNTERELLIRITELLLLHPNIFNREERYEIKDLLLAVKSSDEEKNNNEGD